MESHLDSTILGKLLLIQSTLHVMPDTEKSCTFLITGLSQIPGIDAVAFCVSGQCYHSDGNLFDGLLAPCIQCSEKRVLRDAKKSFTGAPCPFDAMPGFSSIEICTSMHFYGCGIVHVVDEPQYLLYKPYIENTVNLLGVLTENREQHTALSTHRELLENEVANRTAELREEITERKIIELMLRSREEELSERNRFIETIVNLNPNILYIYDIVERKNVFSNNGVERMLGYTAAEIKDMGDRLIPRLMDPDDFTVYVQQTLGRYATAADNQIIDHQYRMRHKNGSWKWLSCSEIIYKRLPDGGLESRADTF